MEATFEPAGASVESWRRATFVTAAIASVELLLLIGIGVALFGGSVLHAVRGGTHARSGVATASVRPHAVRTRPIVKAAAPVLPRDRVGIMVLNGNGENGAAARAAGQLHRLGYRIAGTANAARMNYAMSIVLYRPGYRAEGLRLARELRVRVVGPLDGLRPPALRGGELAVILGR